MRTPASTLSRAGPRKPGHSGSVGARGAGGAAAGISAPASASRRSSGLGVQRHAKSEAPSSVRPPVRSSVQAPQTSTKVATMVAHRAPPVRFRPATAQATRATARIGMARM